MEFTRENFEQSSLGLFKLAASRLLKNLTGKENTAYSLKYQVLSEQTAMVGVVKQMKKVTGEMLEYEIQMGRKLNFD